MKMMNLSQTQQHKNIEEDSTNEHTQNNAPIQSPPPTRPKRAASQAFGDGNVLKSNTHHDKGIGCYKSTTQKRR